MQSLTSEPVTEVIVSPHVAVYWDDLDPSAGGTVASFFDGRRFIISWDAVPHASGLGEVR